jgi:hypothetical protein
MEKKKFIEIEKMAEIVKSYCDVCPVKDKEQETCLLCKMEHLYNHNYRNAQDVAQEIIDLANELILTVESEQAYTNFTLEVFKAGIRLMQTKIMERYGR